MSELIGGGDETLVSLWLDNFFSKPATTLDLPLKDQQIVPVPIVLLDDGRVAFKSDDGQICFLDGLQGVGEGEDVFLPLPPCMEDPAAELPSLSDAAIKSMLVQNDLDSELPLVDPEVSAPELSSKDIPQSPVDDDFRALVSFRCQSCSYSSADVPSLVYHFDTEHGQDKALNEDSSDAVEEAESPLPTDSDVPMVEADEPMGEVMEKLVYLCSECKGAFASVTQCRDHMIQDHNMFDDTEKEDHIDVEGDGDELPQTNTSPPPITPAPATSTVPTPPVLPAPPVLPTIPIKLPTKSSSKPKEYDPEFEAKPHKCREAFCVHKFRTVSNLEQHLECHVSDESRRFSCPHCTLLFVKWGQCALHLWKEHKIDLDLYTCSVCKEYKTTTRKKLESHTKIHSEERPYKCAECGKGFKQQTQLVNHTVSVHNKDKATAPKWYMSQKCEICLKTYADSKCLKKHMQAVHSKLKPYKCQICGHMSARKAMLQAHMRQHTGEKPFSCEMCDFKTGDHNSLRRHMMRHTGKRPYRCSHCSYSSIQSSSFKSHLQSRHPGESGSYTCSQCYFATVSLQSYQQHLSDHRLNLIPPSEVEVFPENVAAAHIVYRSLGASPSRLHCDVTASSTSHDGMKQTITISIPSKEGVITDDEDTAHCYLPGDEIDTGGITIPAEPEADQQLLCFN